MGAGFPLSAFFHALKPESQTGPSTAKNVYSFMMNRDKQELQDTQELVMKAKAGDEAAFNELYAEAAAVARSLIRQKRLFVPGYEIEDLVSECSIMLIRAIDQYDPKRCPNFFGFCHMVFHGKILSLLKVSQTHKKRVLNSSNHLDESVHILADPRKSVAETVCLEQYCASLKKKLYKQFNPLEQAVFEDYINHYSYAEICGRLNINARRVDNTLQRAKAKIPKALKAEIGENKHSHQFHSK